MKLFIISDIHGSAKWLEQALNIYKKEGADQILLLGDLLYHGPRNPLPEGYDPQEVARMLNEHKRHIIAVRGNCDAEVDQMMVDFPILADYTVLYDGQHRIYVTHGHLHHMDDLPPLSEGDIFIQGHTHIPVVEKRDGLLLLNPGSIALPKENNPNSYAIWENGHFRIFDFNGQVIKQWNG